MQGNIIDEGYEKALEVLRKNVTSLGFSASPERKENYYSVWARDHSICSIAACLTDDEELIKTAKQGVLLLLRKQIDHGQVPSYIEIENRKRVYGGLGSITSIDSNMWIVIASAILRKRTRDRRLISANNMVRYARLYRLLKAFDSNDCGLIEVHRAGDWADVFNRTYHVLYDECLYYEALKALTFLFREASAQKNPEEISKRIKKRIRWLSKRRPKVKRRINEFFWFTEDNIPRIMEEYMIYDEIEPAEYNYYQSHLMPFKMYWQKSFEDFGNILAILTNIADKAKKRKIIRYVLENEVNRPFPIRCLDPPVFEGGLGWQSIYKYKEQPYTYHNGGVWPMIAGFWIHALARNRFKRTAKRELRSLAAQLKKQDWMFNEYMHGKTGDPMGKREQAWSAAGYIIAYQSLKKHFSIFDF